MQLQETPDDRRKEENRRLRLALEVIVRIAANRQVVRCFTREQLPMYWNTLDGEKHLLDTEMLVLVKPSNGDDFVYVIRKDTDDFAFGYIGRFSGQFYEQSITTIAREYDLETLLQVERHFKNILKDYHDEFPDSEVFFEPEESKDFERIE